MSGSVSARGPPYFVSANSNLTVDLRAVVWYPFVLPKHKGGWHR